MEFPYQLVTFLAQEPEPSEPIYQGKRGWFAQLALKRRFGLTAISETQLIDKLTQFAAQTPAFEIKIGQVTKPKHMPVRVIEVNPTPELMAFHQNFFKLLGNLTKSKFPDREQDNYYPHITIEHHDLQQIVDPADFENTTKLVNHFWLVKDPEVGDSSYAHIRFVLKN